MRLFRQDRLHAALDLFEAREPAFRGVPLAAERQRLRHREHGDVVPARCFLQRLFQIRVIHILLFELTTKVTEALLRSVRIHWLDTAPKPFRPHVEGFAQAEHSLGARAELKRVFQTTQLSFINPGLLGQLDQRELTQCTRACETF